ncbi:MAG: TssQ family T6SS-associated lipoprotein [Aquabacterium sp.]|nr:TssQ family T6SS-associated lipoprotein [Aquabacterium sp.]
MMFVNRTPFYTSLAPVGLAVLFLLSGCAAIKGRLDYGGAQQSAASSPAPAASSTAAASAPTGGTAPAASVRAAAEVALADGLKAYQTAQYRLAETQLKSAVQAGLAAPADVANAHKHLAFIYCTSRRDKLCAEAFKAAKAADASFALTKAEAGHPMWSKTYKKALGLK